MEEIYQEIMSKLKKDQRPQVQLTQEQLDELTGQLNLLATGPLDMTAKEQLKKILCILDHCRHCYPKLLGPLVQLFKNQNMDSFSLVMGLGVCQKHISAYFLREGLNLPQAYLDLLRGTLYHSDPEVVEWSLRSIEELGTNCVKFKDDFEKIKPSRLRIFNSHNRNIRELIHLMQERF